ncbi:MAG: phosphatase PAP2-related protein [bacterium]
MKNYIKKLWSDKPLLVSIAFSFLLLVMAFVVNYFANQYATVKISNPVTDIILSNTKAIDVDGFFIYGPLVFWIIFVIFLVTKPKWIPFTISSVALFVIVRDAFICMTHLGPFPTAGNVDWLGPMRFFFSGGDLFFSGHTGIPYLMALVFWDNKIVRYICIGVAVIFGVVVLLGHFHYTIDVFAAFFITYSIYVIATKFFKKYLAMFNEAD